MSGLSAQKHCQNNTVDIKYWELYTAFLQHPAGPTTATVEQEMRLLRTAHMG